jgi:hypothetical protein
MAIYLTYDNESLQDGFGAQALRMLGVFSIAKSLKLNYIHSPMKSIVEEFAHSSTNFEHTNTVNRFNEFFKFPDQNHNVIFHKEFYLRNLSIKQLLRIILKYRFSRKIVLVKILLPFGITDRFPSIYKLGVNYLQCERKKDLDSKNESKIVCHVRLGYGWMYGEQTHVRKRKFLSPIYFSELSSKIIYNYYPSSEVSIIVHSDVSEKDVLWKPQTRETLDGYRELTNDSRIEEILIRGRDLSKEFLPPPSRKIEFIYCGDAFETFLDMCRADVLIMGVSAFSYLAGLLNRNQVFWPSVHGHSKLNHWKVETDVGLKLSHQHLETAGSWV